MRTTPLPSPALLVLVACTALLPVAVRAADKESPERAAGKLITPAAERSIERGLAFLAGRQHEDGTFGTGGYGKNVAVVSLCGMAMMSAGSTPGRGPYGAEVSRCLDFILKNTQESGYIKSPSDPSDRPMYGHGFATMFLAECYGMAQRPELRTKLGKAVELIANCQNEQGGWRYRPLREDAADVSVTVCQVMALRAARNAGIYVPPEKIERAIDYIKKCQNPDGGFKYILVPVGESPSAVPRSAAAVVGLYCAGIKEIDQGPEVKQGLNYLVQYLPQRGVERRDAYYFYGHYYAVLAMWQAGGESWARWYPAIRDELVLRQQPNGSWVDLSISNEFATAMACLILGVPNNYLPIFQR